MDKKHAEIKETKIRDKKSDVLTLNNQAKSSKSDILVLDQMIE